MPERLDRVTVLTPNGDVTFSWDTRGMLLSLLEQNEGAAEIRARFDAVGASQPVDLTHDGLVLRDILGEWLTGRVVVPDGISELYIAINMGEPHEEIVEMLAEADAEAGSENWPWRWTHWRDRTDAHDDHQHCMCCHTNIEDDAVTEAWRSLQENDVEVWVCAGCFEKLHERFGWKVEPDASRGGASPGLSER